MSKERKTGIKTFHVFEKPQIIRSPESSKQGNLYNQLKNFKGVFIDPYIVVADYDTKLVHVLEKGERKTIFTPFDGELSYVKASPTRGSPLALFGYDYQEANKVLKVKYFAYNSLSKENPEKRTTSIIRKGREINYDLFHINDTYTAIVLGTSKGQGEIRVLTGKNLALADPTKDVEISLDTQILKHVFVPVADHYDQQSLYYTTQNGIYYLDVVEKNRKGNLISHISPQFCDINKNGEIVFIDYENSTVHKINPANREKDKEIVSEGTKKALYLYEDYAIVISANTMSNSSSVNLFIYDMINEYVALHCSSINQVRSVIPAIKSVFCILDTNIERECDLFVMTEDDNSLKLEKFFRRKFFDLAYRFAKNNNYDDSLLAEISRHHADHLLSVMPDHERAIQHYIKTIGYLEPSYVIRKFLDVSQIEYLISYLEELHNHPNKLANQHHTALLLNCFVKQKSIEKLKEWMTRVSMNTSRNHDYTETAVKVCMDLDQIALAKDFAQKCRHHELYLRILIENKADAKGTEEEIEKTKQTDYLAAIQYIKIDVPFAERAKFIRMFGNSLIKYHPEKVLEILMELINTEFLTSTQLNSPTAQMDSKYRPDSFFHLFIGSKDPKVMDVYGKFLDYLIKNINKLPNQRQILNATFEYYLKKIKDYNSQEYRKHRETTDSDIENIQKLLIKMLKDENLQSKLDKNHVLLLFKINEFTQGVTEVCELLGLKTELLNYYIEKRDLKEILRFCKKNGYDDPNLWITALNFFCSKGSVDETNYTEKLGMIPEILENIVDIENLSHILVLKIMMNNDQIQAKHVKKYFIKKIRNQRSQIQQEVEIIQENMEQIEDAQKKYKKLKTQAQTFQETKCGTCGSQLINPSVHFMCGHSFHENCLESLECPIHFTEQKNIMDKQEYFTKQKLNSKIFESDLAKSKSKFDVVAEYLGKINLNANVE